jgi:Flp pilus assembly protein TadD
VTNARRTSIVVLVAALASGVGHGQGQPEPRTAAEYFDRGNKWAEKGEYEKAVKDYTAAIRLKADFLDAYLNRGTALRLQGKFDEAVKDFAEAVRLKPDDADAYQGRGIAWHMKGEYDKAVKDFGEVIRLRPDDADAYHSRGSTWDEKGEYEKAVKDYSEAVRLKPDHAPVLNDRAWLRATCPDAKYRDGTKAVQDARRACELAKWNNPGWLDTLAAAYAESGQFDEAVKWQRKALEDERFAKTKGEEGRKRLKLYEQKMPYRAVRP